MKVAPSRSRFTPGNTSDPTTVVDQVNKLRERFQLSRVVLVGDRGMLAEGALQVSLLDEKNLIEIQSAHYAGERLMVCYNPLLAEERKRKREELLQATEKALSRIVKEVERRKQKPLTATEIALKVGKVLGK